MVEHDLNRHGPGPDEKWLTLTDNQTVNILVDAMIANHLPRDELALKLRRGTKLIES